MLRHTRINTVPLRLIERWTMLSYPRLFTLWIATVVDFAIAYFLLTTFLPAHGLQQLIELPPLFRFLDSLYFSVITATTVGYGDITPLGISKALAGIEGIIAVIISAIFVTKLVTHKQEYALEQIHRLTYENIFHQTREGLFIARRDIDALISLAEEHRELTYRHWENFITACIHVQSVIEDIPNFYDAEHRLYTIDARRERLLVESIFRTLDRFAVLMKVLAARSIDWRSKGEVLEELRELIRIVQQVLPVWRERSTGQHGRMKNIEEVTGELEQAMSR